MQHVLISNLRLSMSKEESGYEWCAESVTFPGYNYFVTPGGRMAVDKAAGDPSRSSLFDTNRSAWLFSALNTQTIEGFEFALCKGFGDVRSLLSRMVMLPLKIEEDEQDTAWIENTAPKPVEVDEPARPMLPALSNQELLTVAEYDAVVELLKAKQFDAKVRKSLITSMLNTLSAVDNNCGLGFDNASDVLFANLIVSIQMMKYVCPDEARRFMSFVMKAFVISEKRGA